MRDCFLHEDIEFGDDGEPDAATVAALQQLVADRVGGRALRLIPRQASRQVQVEPEDDDDDGDFLSSSYWGSSGGLQRAGANWYPKVTEPQPAGVKLLGSGDFGKTRNRLGTPRNSNVYSRLKRMALLPRAANPADLKHNLIPNTHGTTVGTYYSNIYVAQFSPGASHGKSLSNCICQDFQRCLPLLRVWPRYGKTLFDGLLLWPEARFIYRFPNEHL